MKSLTALVCFSEQPNNYYYLVKNHNVKKNDFVVVDTLFGIKIGKISRFEEIENNDLEEDIKGIIRIADKEDFDFENANKEECLTITPIIKNLIKRYGLDMKVLKVEYSLDRRKLVVFFESEARVDFRNILKELNDNFHTRIELRQIGTRDSARLLGGIGLCGLIYCCSKFLTTFDSVSVKMAKNQDLSIIPSMISGPCNKLLCCIKYEDDEYTALRQTMPKVNKFILGPKGLAQVLSLNLFKQLVQIKNKDDTIEWIELSQIREFDNEKSTGNKPTN
jgi:cell fate regulator YaaT (PSP1 superfamily)